MELYLNCILNTEGVYTNEITRIISEETGRQVFMRIDGTLIMDNSSIGEVHIASGKLKSILLKEFQEESINKNLNYLIGSKVLFSDNTLKNKLSDIAFKKIGNFVLLSKDNYENLFADNKIMLLLTSACCHGVLVKQYGEFAFKYDCGTLSFYERKEIQVFNNLIEMTHEKKPTSQYIYNIIVKDPKVCVFDIESISYVGNAFDRKEDFIKINPNNCICGTNVLPKLSAF